MPYIFCYNLNEVSSNFQGFSMQNSRNQDQLCCLCGKEAQVTHECIRSGRDVYQYSCKACGKFGITWELLTPLDKDYSERKYLISGYTRNKSERHEEILLTTKNIDQIVQEVANLTLSDKKNNLLEVLYLRQEYDGAPLGIILSLDFPLSYAKNEKEFFVHLKFLREEGLLAPENTGNIAEIYLTDKGIESAEKIRSYKNITKIFPKEAPAQSLTLQAINDLTSNRASQSFSPQDIANLAQSCIDNFLTKETADYALLKIGINPASIPNSSHTLTYYVNMIQFLSSRGQLENWLTELAKEGLKFTQEWLEKLERVSK